MCSVYAVHILKIVLCIPYSLTYNTYYILVFILQLLLYTYRYLNPILTTLVGGVLPFGACFVSISNHAVYKCICCLYITLC